MVVGIKHTSKATNTVIVIAVPLSCGTHAIKRVGQERGAHDQKDNRETSQQNIERDFIRSLLSLRAFDEADHAVKESLPRVSADADDEPV